MLRIMRTTVATVAATAAIIAGTVAAGAATADAEFPTVGDRIQYVFYSDNKINEYAVWYDANNDMQDISNVSLPTRSKDGKRWSGSISLTSRSTYQLAGASIQTSGYFASCRTYVNGTLVAEDKSTGRYSVAVC